MIQKVSISDARESRSDGRGVWEASASGVQEAGGNI